MSSSLISLKTRCVGERCTLNLSKLQASSRWCHVEVMRGGCSSGVIFVTCPCSKLRSDDHDLPMLRDLEVWEWSPNVSFNKSIVACCAVLLEPQLLDIMIVQFRNEKVSNHGSIPITIDCNVVAFIVFEEVPTNDSTSP
ncbi:hypothetical protein TNCV_1787301 [Trichonephila clavipes]|nr:hypothetical protein TNCV_1787301 [Trichonephila clavipes]